MSLRIHISKENINTVVNMNPMRKLKNKYFITTKGDVPKNIRVINFDSSISDEVLLQEDNLSTKLKKGDPEVDFSIVGKEVKMAKRILVNDEFQPVYDYRAIDILERTSGETIERPHQVNPQNINDAIPVRITDTYYSRDELVKNFVFTKSYYLSHVDGVSYLFLYDIAAELAEKNKMVKVQAYDQQTKTPASLVTIVGSRPYPAAFLEGRVDGDNYSLILHLSNRELKLPKTQEITPTTKEVKSLDQEVDDLFQQLEKEMEDEK